MEEIIFNQFAERIRRRDRNFDRWIRRRTRRKLRRILALDRGKDRRAYSRYEVSGHSVRFLLDSGATVNLLPINVVKTINCIEQMKPATSDLHMFDGTTLKTAGVVNLAMKHPKTGFEQTVEFYVTTVHKQPLLGKDACVTFDLIHINGRD